MSGTITMTACTKRTQLANLQSKVPASKSALNILCCQVNFDFATAGTIPHAVAFIQCKISVMLITDKNSQAIIFWAGFGLVWGFLGNLVHGKQPLQVFKVFSVIIKLLFFSPRLFQRVWVGFGGGWVLVFQKPTHSNNSSQQNIAVLDIVSNIKPVMSMLKTH